jgi:AP-2 complex subunit alpha
VQSSSNLGYILGEYGHLIANEHGYSPSDQLAALQGKSHFSSAATRALLLSTYVKWVNVFPEIKPQLVNIFDRYRHVLDTELQQRACEYYAICLRPDDDDLLPRICEEMPPFPERESALLGRLHAKHGDTNDKRIWIIGGKDANLDRETTTRLGTIRRPRKGGTAPPGNANATPDLVADTSEHPSSVSDGGVLASLAGLNLSGPTTDSEASAVGTNAPRFERNVSIDRWFERLTYSPEGVLFEDVQIQIGVKSEFHGHLGRVALYFGNKMLSALTSFTAIVDGFDPDALSVTFAKIPQTVIHPTSQSQQLLQGECKNIFTAPPILQVSFVAGALQTHRIQLPIVLSKFFEPVRLTPEDFFERWKLIGGPPREAQQIFPIRLDSSGSVESTKQQKIVLGSRFQILPDVDPNPTNIVAAGVFHMSVGGKVGCLLRVEPNREAKVRSSIKPRSINYHRLMVDPQLCRITVRSTSEIVSADILSLLSKPMNANAAAS